MRTMAGVERFRTGSDLYFERHDGEAATCEDFVSAIEDGAGLDLKQFRRWYSQAGTPKVTVRLEHAEGTATLHLGQQVAPTPGQPEKQPMVIPLRLALFDRASGAHRGEELVVLSDAETSISFEGFVERPVLSINRGFSAPVSIEREVSHEDLVFLAAHDDDPFARYEAMQELTVGHLTAAVGGGLSFTCVVDGGLGNDDISSAIAPPTKADDETMKRWRDKMISFLYGGAGDDSVTCLVAQDVASQGVLITGVADGGADNDVALVSGRFVDTLNCEDVTDVDAYLF